MATIRLDVVPGETEAAERDCSGLAVFIRCDLSLNFLWIYRLKNKRISLVLLDRLPETCFPVCSGKVPSGDFGLVSDSPLRSENAEFRSWEYFQDRGLVAVNPDRVRGRGGCREFRAAAAEFPPTNRAGCFLTCADEGCATCFSRDARQVRGARRCGPASRARRSRGSSQGLRPQSSRSLD